MKTVHMDPTDPNMHLSYSGAFHSALSIKEQPPQPGYMDQILLKHSI
jgi:hypothetical protein